MQCAIHVQIGTPHTSVKPITVPAEIADSYEVIPITCGNNVLY